MDELINKFSKMRVENWKEKFEYDLHMLAYKYINYETDTFIHHYPSEHIPLLIDHLSINNNARIILTNKIKELFPNIIINVADIDSIMDYYINSLKLQ